MNRKPGQHRIHAAWWTLILLVISAVFVVVSVASFNRVLTSYATVTLVSDRAGLVMEPHAKVKMRGVEVGRVSEIGGGASGVGLQLEIKPDQLRHIPANVQARIMGTTAFGSKFVDLVYPADPSPARLAAGAVVHSENVSIEVNTVFETVVDLLKRVDPMKLNAVLSAVAQGVRGQGERMGEATTSLNRVLSALNERADTMQQNWRTAKALGDTYDVAAPDITRILDALSTTSTTVVKHATDLDVLLLNATGFYQAGTELLATSGNDLVVAVNSLEPTTELLRKYSPTYACTLQGAQWFLDNGGRAAMGGADKRTLWLDVGLLPGNEMYTYPENLSVFRAKGGPDGKPGCGSLPDATKNFPVRQLITDTGWGTGIDIRPNPGIGQYCYADFFRVTRAEPLPPALRECLPGPAVGPQPELGFGTPPYGAALYGPGGVPLFPGVPPAEGGPPPS